MKLLKKQTIVISIAILAILFAVLAFIPSKEAVAVEEYGITLPSDDRATVVVTEEMEKSFTDLHYIENANYFITNPLHGDNNGKDNSEGTCTTVALQMLMGYHNYYTDRRLIPATDENGELFLSFDYGNLAQHPEIDTSISRGIGRGATGTHDNFYKKLLDFNRISAVPGVGQNYESVIRGARAFVSKYTSEDIVRNVSLDDWGGFVDSMVKAELNKGNPVIVGCAGLGEMKFHVMVAYGYATYNSEEGYIVHMGYYSDETKNWIPKSLLVYQLRMFVYNHTHDFVDSGRYVNGCYRESICSVCGANTLETIFATDNEKKAITGLNYPINSEEIVLPNYVMHSDSSGKIQKENIVSIENGAFSGAMSDAGVYNMTISDEIENIGDYAFKDCSSLRHVQFGKNIQRIGCGAFENCSSLTEVLLGSKVNYIGLEAFKDCLSLKDVYLGKSVKHIGRRAFQNCYNIENITLSDSLLDLYTEDFIDLEKLKNIDVPYENSVYSSSDGVLYNKDKSVLIFYPSGKTDTNFSVDTDCKELASFAFTNNSKLRTLNLVNTKIINRYSIMNCPSLATITAPDLEISYPSAITGTKFTDETADIILGTILFKKTSAGEIVELDENIKTIAHEAFVGNESIKKLILRGYNFRKIGDNAFSGCSTLENIEIYNLNEVVSLGTGALDGVSTNLKIKVPQKYLNTYKTETAKGWTSFANNLTTLDKLSVKYVVGDKVVKESFVDYGNEIGEDYKYIDDSEAYYAKTWKTADGTEIKGYHTVTDDMVLYGELEPYTFTITYVTNGGEYMDTGLYNVENDFELPEATRAGYTFKGWYTSPDRTEESKIDSIIRKGTRTGDFTVYAKWQANTYIVTFRTTIDGQVLPQQHVVFGESFIFDKAYSDGRIFNGWKDENGRMLTNSSGNSLLAWDIPKSTTVYADWILIEYTITYENVEGVMTGTQKFTIEDLDFELPTPERKGGRFDGWFADSMFKTEIVKISDIGDITLYAKWSHLYLLRYDARGGYFNSEDKESVLQTSAYSGDEIDLPIAYYPGQKSGSWRCPVDNKLYTFGEKYTLPESNEFIYYESLNFNAEWVPNTYTITFNFNGGKSTGSSTMSVTAIFGVAVPDIVLPEKSGYVFFKYSAEGKDLYVRGGYPYFSITRNIYEFDHNVTLKAEWASPYPELSVLGKTGNKWKIGVKNNVPIDICFTYNTKMCYEKDAKAWSGLSDLSDVVVGNGKTETVYITENWFATCIVVSMKLDSTRYITYAYNLDANTKTLTPVNCYVSA